jgi:S1-C subfamily serine protease
VPRDSAALNGGRILCPQEAAAATVLLAPGRCAVAREIFFHTDGCGSREPTLRPADGGRGMVVSGIGPQSVYHRCGFANGDVWVKINETLLSTPEEMLTSYRKLVEAPAFSVSLLRAGKPLDIVVELE